MSSINVAMDSTGKRRAWQSEVIRMLRENDGIFRVALSPPHLGRLKGTQEKPAYGGIFQEILTLSDTVLPKMEVPEVWLVGHQQMRIVRLRQVLRPSGDA